MARQSITCWPPSNIGPIANCSPILRPPTVITLDVNRYLPDCAFVEDTAVVLDEIAMLTTMGAESRRAELSGIAAEVRKYRKVVPMSLPATLEGGDVLKVGKTLLVGPIVCRKCQCRGN